MLQKNKFILCAHNNKGKHKKDNNYPYVYIKILNED